MEFSIPAFSKDFIEKIPFLKTGLFANGDMEKLDF